MKKHEADMSAQLFPFIACSLAKTHSLAVVGAKSVQLRISCVLTIVSEKSLPVCQAIEGNNFFGLVFNHH